MENTVSIVEACLPNHCIETVAARTHRKQYIIEAFLPSRCLAMSINFTIHVFFIDIYYVDQVKENDMGGDVARLETSQMRKK
jgi:hypothetical protein